MANVTLSPSPASPGASLSALRCDRLNRKLGVSQRCLVRRDHIREGKGSVPKEAHDEGLRVARALQDRIEARGLSVRRVEERVGWGQGTLNLALTGRTPLRISHVAAVCRAIDYPLAEFYRDLAKEIEAPAPHRRQKEVAPGLSDEELLEAVRDLIRRHKPPLRDEE